MLTAFVTTLVLAVAAFVLVGPWAAAAVVGLVGLLLVGALVVD